MKGAHIVKHSVNIAGHQTSISLEEIFWEEFQNIAAERAMSLRALIAEVDGARDGQNLSSAIRVFVLEATRARSERA